MLKKDYYCHAYNDAYGTACDQDFRFTQPFWATASKRRTEALASVQISCFLFCFSLFVALFFTYVLSTFSRKQPQQCNNKKQVNQSTCTTILESA